MSHGALLTDSSSSPLPLGSGGGLVPPIFFSACDVTICLCGCNAGGRALSGGALPATPPGDAEPSPGKPEEPRLGGLLFLISSVCRFISVYFG